jgi:hypothetical protein
MKPDFVNILDDAIEEFHYYKENEKDNSKKIIFSAVVSRLYNLRTAYFEAWEKEVKGEEK